MECVLVLRGRNSGSIGGGGLRQTEAKNGVVALQRLLYTFQRPASQISETKTCLTPGRAITKKHFCSTNEWTPYCVR